MHEMHKWDLLSPSRTAPSATPPCVYHVHSLTVSANLSERTTTAQVFSAFVFGAYSIRHSERQWERDGDTLGQTVCLCVSAMVSA